MYKEEAFAVGEDFLEASQRLIPEDIFDNDGHWLVPYIVNRAFACELFLKSLISNGDNVVSGHKWSELFDQLKPEIKQEILNHPSFKGDDDFFAKLDEGSKLFVEWRYIFEHNKPKSVEFVFLDSFADVLYQLGKNAKAEE